MSVASATQILQESVILYTEHRKIVIEREQMQTLIPDVGKLRLTVDIEGH